MSAPRPGSRPPSRPGSHPSSRAGSSAPLVQRAAALLAQGQAAEAAQLLTQAVTQHPADPEPWLQLGNLVAGAGHWATAERCYASRCKLPPAVAPAFYNWGVALTELGRHDEAATAYARALQLQPAYPAARHAVSLACQRRGAPAEALEHLNQALNADPGHALCRLERAGVWLKLGQWAAALEDLAGLPPSADVCNRRGIALKHLQRPAEALAAYDQALQLRPDMPEALNNRGNLRLLARQFTAALADLDRAAALQPDGDWLQGLRLYAALHLYQWPQFEAEVRALQTAVAQGRRVVQPLALQCVLDDPQAQLQAARLWAGHAFPPRGAWAPAPDAAPSDGRVRVAYLSRDFRPHPVAYLMAEVFELHDRQRFEVMALSYGPLGDDPLQQRLRAAFDRFDDVSHWTDAQVAQHARRLGVDIVVDLTGFTDGARSGILACRPAPVQMLYLGTLGTAGSPVVDYLLADATVVPPEGRQACDEAVIYLPSYQANDRQRPRPAAASREALGLPAEAFVFCCFNNPCKIVPTQFAAWAEILHAVPGSVLWVLDEDAHASGNLRAHAAAAGLAPERLVFAHRCGREAYLARLAAADLFLDTLPYNAGTTASDALWMGLPVLTQPGRSFPARVAASLLTAVGLPELIAADGASYVATAVRLAHDPAALAALRARLAAAVQDGGSALFDTPRFTRHLEAAYLEAHRRQQAGEPTRDLVVAPLP
ncbi:tetratricopeptide repeat protein [Roseateles sp. BYS87W]|uniref:protein O-GlcNAc transferase n=1 Tax=Pelomonas baiyunensis TaxID=3299026 RepID=A0ABW7GUV8_9BURK